MRRLLIAAGTLAVLNTVVESFEMRAAVYVLKPLATLALAVIALRASRGTRYGSWIAAGLCLSLAGDILLMLPFGLFVPGLVAFFVAHLCYIAAFARDGGGLRAPWAPAIPVFGVAIAMLAVLWPTLGAMRVPVACYVMVISVMSWQAIARWLTLRTRGAAFAAAGSLCFLASDSALAIRRFSAPFAGATLVIFVTYYAAQWGLALSVRRDDATTP